jgi:hypothetical protein
MVTDNVVIVQRNGVTARRSSQKLDGSSSTRELLAHCDTILRAPFLSPEPHALRDERQGCFVPADQFVSEVAGGARRK